MTIPPISGVWEVIDLIYDWIATFRCSEVTIYSHLVKEFGEGIELIYEG